MNTNQLNHYCESIKWAAIYFLGTMAVCSALHYVEAL